MFLVFTCYFIITYITYIVYILEIFGRFERFLRHDSLLTTMIPYTCILICVRKYNNTYYRTIYGIL